MGLSISLIKTINKVLIGKIVPDFVFINIVNKKILKIDLNQEK